MELAHLSYKVVGINDRANVVLHQLQHPNHTKLITIIIIITTIIIISVYCKLTYVLRIELLLCLLEKY